MPEFADVLGEDGEGPLGKSGLVVFKGDLKLVPVFFWFFLGGWMNGELTIGNHPGVDTLSPSYRKLTADAQWKITEPFEAVLGPIHGRIPVRLNQPFRPSCFRSKKKA